MRVYNSLSREIEEFIPLDKNEVKIYLCGPTVYNKGHIGNARSMTSCDIIIRYLKYKGYDVKFISNYTDIDDKMIEKANLNKISVKELSNEIIPYWENDIEALNILQPNIRTRATDYIQEMISIIQILMDKNHAYIIDDGIYFSVESYKDYGQLSRHKLSDLKHGARVDLDNNKKHPADFALWKFKKEGEPFWGSPWGDGRPGWHIECSAMIKATLGESIDIHLGGEDLRFPHHEDEIAQSECAFNKKFVKYWMHNAFIMVDDDKMSKSLDNFKITADIIDSFGAIVTRFALLKHNYRKSFNFDRKLIQSSEAELNRLFTFIVKLKELSENDSLSNSIDNGDSIDNNVNKLISIMEAGFVEAMDNDFDIHHAIKAIFDLMKEINLLIDDNKLNSAAANCVLKALYGFDSVLGIIKLYDSEIAKLDIENIMLSIDERNKARLERNFEIADKIRDELKEKNIILEDCGNKKTLWRLKC